MYYYVILELIELCSFRLSTVHLTTDSALQSELMSADMHLFIVYFTLLNLSPYSVSDSDICM